MATGTSDARLPLLHGSPVLRSESAAGTNLRVYQVCRVDYLGTAVHAARYVLGGQRQNKAPGFKTRHLGFHALASFDCFDADAQAPQI